MGCDMHFHLERLLEGGWINVATPRFDYWRSYTLFAELGYRGRREVASVAELRGMPEDATAESREDFESWTVDAHSPGWLTIGEILASLPEDPELRADQQRFHFLERLQQAVREPLNSGDRIVFWFDN